MAAPVLYFRNYIRDATLSVPGAAPGRPASRLRDGNIRRPYEDSGNTGNRDYVADRGAGNLVTVDAFAIPPGHNLAGQTVEFWTADNALVYTVRDSVVPSSSAAVLRTFAAVANVRAFRLRVASPAAAPIFHEWHVSLGRVLSVAPSEGTGGISQVAQVSLLESPNGHIAKVKLGPSRWQSDWVISAVTESEALALRDHFRDDLDHGTRHLVIKDELGTARFVEWFGESVELTYEAVLRDTVTLRFRELTAVD